MQLFLVRHAHAVSAEENSRRPLSERGHGQVELLVTHFRSSDAFRPAEFWHSPLIRSRETAALLAAGLSPRAPLIEIPGLEPEDSPSSLLKRLARVKHDLALVGHEPHLSALAALLAPGPETAAHHFSKGAVLALERSGRDWLVRWSVSPKQLEATA